MHALHSRNRNIPEIVEYWECLAALEETRGDIKMAVDSYQRAIMRGAEVSIHFKAVSIWAAHMSTC